MHAVLGVVELEDSLAKKDDTAKLTNIFTHNFDFGNNQKTDLPKRQIIKKLDQPKQTCLKELLTKWKLFFTKTFDQKMSQFWKPTKPSTNKAEEKNLRQRDLTERLAESSQATINQNFDRQQKQKLKRPSKIYRREKMKTRTEVSEKEKPAKTTAKKRFLPIQ